MRTLYRLKPSFAAALTPEFLGGAPSPNLEDYLETAGEEFDPDLIKAVFEMALSSEKGRFEVDRSLAARFHYVFRISRRTAGDRGVWAWLATTICRPYVVWRFADEGTVWAPRYYGDPLRNGVSRLWWAAEMTRNGPSYEHVPIVLNRVRTAEFALELRYSWYRAAAIAFTRVAEGIDGNRRLLDPEMKALSKSINAYLSLTGLEAMGLSQDENGEFDEDWRSHLPSLAEATEVEVTALSGPRDGFVSSEAIKELERWFRAIADVAIETDTKAT